MTQYRLEPSPPPRNPTRSLIVGLILVLLFVVVVASIFLLSRMELTLGPTATPTATFALAQTATPDFGATRVAQDLATQQAGPAAVNMAETKAAMDTNSIEVSAAETDTPSAAPPEIVVVTVTVIVTVTAPPAGNAESAALQPSPVAVSVIATPVATSPLATPTDASSAETRPTITINLPLAAGAAPTTPLQLPTATATATPPVPTATPLPIAPSPTISPTPSPVFYRVDYLLAEVDDTDVDRRFAPVSRIDVESDQTWNTEDEVRLLGRTSSGEWVYGEQDGERGWVRLVHLRFLDIDLPGDAPDDVESDDVRLLPIQPWPSDVEPLPEPTPIPADDYPLVRRNRANHDRVNQLPPLPYASIWPNGYYEAGDSFASPLAVAGDIVVVANADRHIYAISRGNGTQKWRLELDNGVTQSLAMQGETVYAVDVAGTVYAVEQSGRLWSTPTEMEPTAGVTIAGERVIVVGRAGDERRLVLLNLNDGAIIDTFRRTGEDFLFPAVGDQLIYVVGSRVWALDLYHAVDDEDETAAQEWREVWSFGTENGVKLSSPPVYASPGPTTLAELYAGAADGRVYLLDANTGKRLEWYESGQPVTDLAIDDRRLYAAGPNQDNGGLLRAYNRESRDLLWDKTLTSLLVSGPIADGEEMIVFQEDGTVAMLRGDNGAELGRVFIPTTLRGGAVSGRSLFAAGSNNKIYAFEESN